MTDYALGAYDAGVLVSTRELADYFEAVVAALGGEPKLCANWITGELAANLNKANVDISASPVSADSLAALLRRVRDGTISGKIAKQVFEAIWSGEGSADAVIEARGLKQISGAHALEPVVAGVIEENPGQVEQYRAGRSKLLGFFVGRVMKVTGGKANPQQVNDLVRQMLDDA